MANLIGQLLGTRQIQKGKGSQDQTTRRVQDPRMKMLQDVLLKELLGQLVNPSNTAISVPTQQAISSAQANMPRLNMQAQYGLAHAAPVDPAAQAMFNGTPMVPGGPTQAGLQTRQQLGLPDRSSYSGGIAPSGPAGVQQLKDIGIPAIPAGSPKLNKVNRRLDTVSSNLDKAKAAGRQGQVEKLMNRQSNLEKRKKALSA